MAAVATPEQTAWLSLAAMGFLACCVYSLYAFARAAQNREPGHQWWHHIPLSGETLTEEGRKHLKRGYLGMIAGAVIVLAAIALTG
jgi:hypothetical protein